MAWSGAGHSRWLCRLRCRFAQVRRADIWAADWSGFDMVYLFQRPESMARAMDKAGENWPVGRWLVSLEFEAIGYRPEGRLEAVDGKPVWLYQTPFRPAETDTSFGRFPMRQFSEFAQDQDGRGISF